MKHHIDVIQAAITGVKAPTPRTGLNTDWQMVDKHDVKTLQEHILRRAKGLEVEVVEQLLAAAPPLPHTHRYFASAAESFRRQWPCRRRPGPLTLARAAALAL